MPCKENIPLSDVAKELDLLWETVADPNKIKASLFNLIVFSETSCRTSYLKEFVKSVVASLPCRILFVEGNELAPANTLRTCVSTETTTKGDVTIHCDKITLETSHDRLKEVPFMILPHILGDLPVYLLWGQDPSTDSAIYPHLEKFADRLIFDSEAIDNLPAFAERLLSMGHKDFIDMNWARLSGWRNLLAQSFNSKKDLSELSQAQTVQITFNSRITSCFFHNEFQAMYLQAWLATLLNWKDPSVKREGYSTTITYRSTPKEKVTVAISSRQEPTLPPGVILNVEVSSHGNYLWSFGCECLKGRVLIKSSSPELCALPYTVPLFLAEEGLHFMRELFYEPPSQHYLKMLETLTHLNNA